MAGKYTIRSKKEKLDIVKQVLYQIELLKRELAKKEAEVERLKHLSARKEGDIQRQ